MTVWQRVMRFKDWFKELLAEYGLEALLFVIAAGNADVLHTYLLETGSKDTPQLLFAIYATELLVVTASLWGTIGLAISFVLFLVSMVSIASVFGDYWLGHSGFSLAIFCGAVGNYVRRGGWRELGVVYNFVVKKVPDVIPVVVAAIIVDIANMSMLDITKQFNTTFTHANLLKALSGAGVVITDRMIEDTRC